MFTSGLIPRMFTSGVLFLRGYVYHGGLFDPYFFAQILPEFLVQFSARPIKKDVTIS